MTQKIEENTNQTTPPQFMYAFVDNISAKNQGIKETSNNISDINTGIPIPTIAEKNGRVTIKKGDLTRVITTEEFHKIVEEVTDFQVAASNDNNNTEVNSGLSDVYKQLIDRIDQDIRDHKQEVRDRDSYYQKENTDREKRYQDEINKLRQESIEREDRARQEAKEREERILAAIERSDNLNRSELNQVKNSVNRIETRVDTATKHIQEMTLSTISLVNQNKWSKRNFTVAIVSVIVAIMIAAFSIWITLSKTSVENDFENSISKVKVGNTEIISTNST